jgi:hypothetical protein
VVFHSGKWTAEGFKSLSKSVSVDLDLVTTKAWRRFRSELADRIADLGEDEVLEVEVEAAVDEPESGCPPYVQFWRGAGDSVMGEVSGNRHLHAAHHLDKVARRRLADIGWLRPRPKHDLFNFWTEVDQSHADQLAVMAVTALQEVFGVMHPAFLGGDVRIGEDPDLPPADTVEPPAEPLATTTSGRSHLDQLVDQALLPLLGPVNRDDDGDIRVESGTAAVFVRTTPHAPMIIIWAEVVVDVTDLERARFEVELLNRERAFAKFVVVDDRILAQVHLSATPFVPEHLRQMLAMMCELTDEVGDSLAVRVKGSCFLEPSDLREFHTGGDSEGSGIHPAMLTLLQLDAGNPGSIRPSLAARVCENDPELLLTLIRWNEKQQTGWRAARDHAIDAGDPDDEADLCEHERAQARRNTKLLRKALRLVVEGLSERP